MLNIAYLLGRQLVVEDDHSDLAVFFLFFLNVLFDFLELSLSYIGGLIGSDNLLRESLDGYSSCRIGKKFQLVEVFFGLGFVLLLGDKTHENGSLCLDF